MGGNNIKIKKVTFNMETYIFLAIISTFFFGVNAIVYKIAPQIDPISLALVSVASSSIIGFLYWSFFLPQKQISTQGVGYGILAGLIHIIALVTFMQALQSGNVSIVSPINALSAAVAVSIAILFLSEKLTLIRGIGILFALISVILLSI